MVRVSVLISDDRVSARVLLIFQFAFFQLGVTKSELVQGRMVMISVASLHGTSQQVPVASNVNTSERYGNLQHGSAAPGIQYVGRRLMHRGYAMLPGMGPVFDQGIPVGGDQSNYENFTSLQQQFVPMSNVPAETTSSQPQAQPTTSSGANNDHAHQRSQEKLLSKCQGKCACGNYG